MQFTKAEQTYFGKKGWAREFLWMIVCGKCCILPAAAFNVVLKVLGLIVTGGFLWRDRPHADNFAELL